MPEYYRILDWDTSFFKFNVAEIKNDILQARSQQVLADLNSSGVELAYYKSSLPLQDLRNKYYDVKFIVRRVPLEKKVVTSSPIHKSISVYSETKPDEALIRLAQLAGRQGRFGKDSNISNEICDEIFKSWIINSVNRKMASHVLVYRDSDQIVGFATIDIRDGKGYTPLFAVDRKSEGKGVSFALMRAVETILKENGCNIVMGGTQELNKKALMVYQRYGLIPQPPEYVYHLWKIKSN